MSDNSLNAAQSSGAASVDMPNQTTPSNNPLLEAWPGPHETPAFDRFRNEDYMPAFQQALKEARAEVVAIVTNPDEPTFANTIEALEFSGRRLDDLCNLFFNLNEACTAVSYELPIITIIFNNQVLGMVRQWQSTFYGKRYSSTDPQRKTDFPKLAEAFGAQGCRCQTQEEFEAVRTALNNGLSDIYGAPVNGAFRTENGRIELYDASRNDKGKITTCIRLSYTDTENEQKKDAAFKSDL